MTTQLTPPDLAQCQAEITTHRPFVMGGPTRVVERCKSEPTVIAREKKPGADGLTGSMSLCASCAEVARKTLGDDFMAFESLPRRFTGHRSFDQIVAECKAQGVELDASNYVNRGSDFLSLKGGGFQVLYSTVNGQFFGTTPTGEKFHSSEVRDGEPWFSALLGFFYYTE